MSALAKVHYDMPDAALAAAPHRDAVQAELRRGRGAVSNAGGRYEPLLREVSDDGWGSLETLPAFKTETIVEKPKSIITRNESPDLGFDRSINPYRGCEHGCVYCFARPTHAYMGLSPGLDFESRLFVKEGAAQLLERELARDSYVPKTIAIGTNTDPYQPIERKHRLTRGIVEVLAKARHPLAIVTKSALVVRDIDILAPMARLGLVKVAISITTLDPILARKLEPRAPTPQKRLETIKELAKAGIPVSVMVAPIIPGVNDAEIETILTRAQAYGASEAGYVMLRLPLEVKDLFRQWLLEHYPDKLRHVLSLVQSTHEGKDYDAAFGTRMTGTGPYAWMLGRRFEIAAQKLGLNARKIRMRTDLFEAPSKVTKQLSLLELL